MNSYYGTDAVVLALQERGEADMGLMLFTKDLGRIRALATGIRLAKSKLRGHLTLFQGVRLMLARGSTTWRVIDAEVTQEGLARDLFYPKRCADFITRISGEEQPDLDLWDIALHIAQIKRFADEARFKLQALKIAGFLPAREHLHQFFTSRAFAFIEGAASDSIFDDIDERKAFEEGIEGILKANHMVY